MMMVVTLEDDGQVDERNKLFQIVHWQSEKVGFFPCRGDYGVRVIFGSGGDDDGV